MFVEIRQSARAVVINEQNEVLLFEFAFEAFDDNLDPTTKAFWIMPGGGLHAGETFEAALARELGEEVGLRGPQIGPWLWTRR